MHLSPNSQEERTRLLPNSRTARMSRDQSPNPSERDDVTSPRSVPDQNGLSFCSRLQCAAFCTSSSPARLSNPRVYCFMLLMLLPHCLLLAAIATTHWHEAQGSHPSMHSGLLVNCTASICQHFEDIPLGYEMGAFFMISALLLSLLVPIKTFAIPRWSWENFLTIWILLWFVFSMAGVLLASVSSPYGSSGSTGSSCFMAVTASGLSLLVWLVKLYVSCDSG